MKILFFLIIIFVCASLHAQEMQYDYPQQDTTTVTGQKDSLSVSDLLNQENEQEKQRKIKVQRKRYNFRNQVGSAVGMMIFVAIILFTVQNWNPD